HTRWPRDWSSDVCSSDLGAMKVKCKESLFEVVAEIVGFGICRCGRSRSEPAQLDGEHFSAAADKIVNGSGRSSTVVDAVLRQVTSEERRVGKEWRCKWGA